MNLREKRLEILTLKCLMLKLNMHICDDDIKYKTHLAGRGYIVRK